MPQRLCGLGGDFVLAADAATDECVCEAVCAQGEGSSAEQPKISLSLKSALTSAECRAPARRPGQEFDRLYRTQL